MTEDGFQHHGIAEELPDGKGGLDMGKWRGTKAKMDPVMGWPRRVDTPMTWLDAG